MEKWQIDHIHENLVQLIKNTTCDSMLITELISANVLSHSDGQRLELSTLTPFDKAKLLYEILESRVGSYEVLRQKLNETNQTNAARILKLHHNDFRSFGLITYNKNHILGIGCYGTRVFKGSFDGREVAVKAINTDYVTFDDISNEVNFLKALDNHPNIVRHFYSERHDNYVYIALELCVISLQDEILMNLIGMAPRHILEMCTKGLEHLHAQNIIHLDIKPGNVLLKYHDQVKLADFGISKQIPKHMESVSLPYRVGAADDWMAPEILESVNAKENPKGNRMSKSADIFPLGCVFVFALTNGAHPFGDVIERKYNIRRNKLRISDSNMGSEWLELILKMLSQNPRERPTCTEILTDICFNSSNNPNETTCVISSQTESPKKFVDVLNAIDYLIEWFKEVESQLADAYKSGCESEVVRIQLQADKTSNAEISKQQGTARDVVDKATQLFCDYSDSENTGILRKKAEDLDDLVDKVSTLISDRLTVLEHALTLATKQLKTLASQICELDNEFENVKPVGCDIPTVKTQIREIQTFTVKAIEKRSDMEHVTNVLEDLIKNRVPPAANGMKDHIEDLRKKWSWLDTKARQRQDELNNMIVKLDGFHNMCNTTNGDINDLVKQERLFAFNIGGDAESIHVKQALFLDFISRNVDAVGNLVDEVNINGSVLMQSAANGVGKTDLEKALEKINGKWNTLRDRIIEHMRKLHAYVNSNASERAYMKAVDLFDLFTNLRDAAKKRKGKFEKSLAICKRFQGKVDTLSDWIEKKTKELERMPILTFDDETLASRIKKHNKYHEGLLIKQPFNDLADYAMYLMDFVGNEEAVIVCRKLKQVNDSRSHLLKESDLVGERFKLYAYVMRPLFNIYNWFVH